MRPQAKEHQGWPAAPGAGRGRKDPPLEPPERARPCPHLDLRLLAPECGRVDFCCFKPRGLWSFVMVAQEAGAEGVHRSRKGAGLAQHPAHSSPGAGWFPGCLFSETCWAVATRGEVVPAQTQHSSLFRGRPLGQRFVYTCPVCPSPSLAPCVL